MTPFQKLVRTPGEITRIARELRISTQAISQWKALGYVPAPRVLDVERLTGIHRHYLNAGIYPDRPDGGGAQNQSISASA